MSWVTTVLVIAAVVIAVDAAATVVLQRIAGREVSRVIGAGASVRLRGWPAALRLATGLTTSARIVATEVPVEPTTIARLQIDLEGVRRSGDAHGEERHHLAVRSGRYSARIDDDALAALMPAPVRDVHVGDGRVRFSFPGDVTVDTAVEVQDGVLLLRPVAGRIGVVDLLRITPPIGELPFGATIADVETVSGALVVHGCVQGVTLGAADASR
ncbi:MAG: DUF2993 domain-containing protein [Actinomycetota bacterium]|nr:DUF2993 domain-containing protein [Actinomycetota bacterium]